MLDNDMIKKRIPKGTNKNMVWTTIRQLFPYTMLVLNILHKGTRKIRM